MDSECDDERKVASAGVGEGEMKYVDIKGNSKEIIYILFLQCVENGSCLAARR